MTPRPPVNAPADPSDVLMFIDPDPLQKGMLLSDRIRFYVDNLKMIWPFHETHLRPASYELTLGSEYLFNRDGSRPGSLQKLEPGQELLIPPNSIVFVSTEEKLTLPFYVAARFNVKVNLVYEGLLLGTGPQVDPGFRGRLSCPLHNISSQEVRLRAGESFAIIDFEKTTTFAESEFDIDHLPSNEVRRRGSAGELRGFKGHSSLAYPADRLDRAVIMGLLPKNKSVSSSLAPLAERIKSAETTITGERNRIDSEIARFNTTSIIAILVVVVSISAFFWQAVNWGRALRDDAKSAVNEVRTSPADYKELRDRVVALETEVKELRATRANPGSASTTPNAATPK
jgi:deoxycytidine triphosphate deaminase